MLLCPMQLAPGAISTDRAASNWAQTASLLGGVLGHLAADASWRPHLPELLQNLDEVGTV